MNKQSLILCLLLLLFTAGSGQQKALYNPGDDAQKEIDYAVTVARSQGKHVLIQAGGNWCQWCIEFEQFSKNDSSINAIIQKNFIVYHLNWSKENQNKKTFARYGFPQRFGFPVFLILNAKGERLHTQDSAWLEDGKKSYDPGKVKAFLMQWTPKMLAPSTYGM